jgi:adenylosuccinate lyase
MSRVFSEYHRAKVWRELWVILAEEEKKLGLPIENNQIQQMKKAVEKIDFERIRHWELKLKHDVMSHVKAFGEVAPAAEPIIHLGATSAFVTDNADVLILQEATQMVVQKICRSLKLLDQWIDKWSDVPTAGFTHFQPAQPVTIGKRLSLWAQDLKWDIEELEFSLQRLLPLGCKGATGTQASFLTLFSGDAKKVKALDDAVSKRMGFSKSVAVSGQTLSRKVDTWFLDALAHFGSSASKLSYDLRLLQHLGEMKEPFGKAQVGSSAMAYKRNPILAERICSLSRFLMSLSVNGTWTHSVQWLERSLDDSANRRISLAEAFLTADALCELLLRIFQELEIDREKIKETLHKNAAHFQTEAYMMKGTLKGGSRQELHEEVRKSTHAKSTKNAASKISKKTEEVDSIDCGLAAVQARDFLKSELRPFLKERQSLLKGQSSETAVQL